MAIPTYTVCGARTTLFEIPAVNVNRQNVDQIVNDYIKNIPKYDFANFYARWSVAIPWRRGLLEAGGPAPRRPDE